MLCPFSSTNAISPGRSPGADRAFRISDGIVLLSSRPVAPRKRGIEPGPIVPRGANGSLICAPDQVGGIRQG
jgi:hypothetical protein